MDPKNEIEQIYEETRALPIQTYETPPPPPEDVFEPETLPDGSEYISDKKVKSEMNALKLNEPLANLLVTLLNIVLPAIACNFSPEKSEDKQDFKMDSDEEEAMTFALSNYIKETDFNLSPAGALIGTALSIYAPKFIYVFYTKKQQHTDAMMAMQKQIELLTQQNEMLRAKK